MKGFLFLVIAALTVLVVGFTGVVSGGDGPQQATGIKIGEVGEDSAIVWTRLTEVEAWEAAPQVKEIKSLKEGSEEMAAAVDLWAVPGTEGEVRVRYWPVGGEKSAKETAWEAVEVEKDYTRAFLLEGLQGGTTYELKVEGREAGSDEVSSTVEGGFKTAPAVDDAEKVVFTVVTGQGYHRRDDDENGHGIYPLMWALDPNFFVHTGDILYYDKAAPDARSADLARVKWQRMYALPYQRDFHAQVGSYFIKDDHDTLDNDSWPGKTYGELTWDEGLAIFREQVPMGESTFRTQRWGKDLQVWFVEGRDFRSPNTMPDGPEKTIWGEEQKEWFKRTVEESDATFRILVSPTPIVGPDRTKKNDNHANEGFQHEGDEIRSFLADQENMYVVCGDRHWQYVTVDPETGVREYSCGPTTDKHAGGFSQDQRSDMHEYLNIKGGFLSVTVERDEDGESPRAVFRHHGVDGEVYHEDVRDLE
ncbi:MAG: alkaline phosphatase D family protein [Verrucomicrobiota bacterium]